MKRRAVVFQGAVVLASTFVASPFSRSGLAQSPVKPNYDWPISDLRSGGTTGLSASLPVPTFRAQPQCAVTLNKILGPCHTNNVPIRYDVTEGVSGLPVRVSLRVVEASSCKPIANADIEIWHADVRGVYSGRAAAMCNPGDDAAKSAGYLRGRQITDANGVASFLTIYPGWYGSRTPHIHLRVLVDDRELLISQLLFDDRLNDMIYGQHPDYAGRPRRHTKNDSDFVFSTSEIAQFTFDVERLDGGILQANYTIGLKDQSN
ncbi:protocatechuate 3,4-dioxygenase [Agrobacterium tumefaciens]|uniref:dioxygenase family protein n=1 Tax=Agrobacterium tumefaciens TaxID=358 RepID=UPI0005582CC9|nr:protocatechuate 3,4-dioxygenase [Agrobacterium tumefaciens]